MFQCRPGGGNLLLLCLWDSCRASMASSSATCFAFFELRNIDSRASCSLCSSASRFSCGPSEGLRSKGLAAQGHRVRPPTRPCRRDTPPPSSPGSTLSAKDRSCDFTSCTSSDNFLFSFSSSSSFANSSAGPQAREVRGRREPRGVHYMEEGVKIPSCLAREAQLRIEGTG